MRLHASFLTGFLLVCKDLDDVVLGTSRPTCHLQGNEGKGHIVRQRDKGKIGLGTRVKAIRHAYYSLNHKITELPDLQGQVTND